MADIQTNPHVVEQHPVRGPDSIGQAQEALLGLLNSEEQPDQEEQPSEETQDVETSDEAIEDSERSQRRRI